MAAPLERTRHPGIYKRGERYVVIFRDLDGRQRKETSRTLDEARRLQAKRRSQVHDGEFQEQSRTTFEEYAREWVERYQGRGRHGFRDATRDDYRSLLERYAFRFFGPRRRVSEITPRLVAQFVGWLCDEREQGRQLSDSTVRNILNPVRSCLATAMQEGLIRSNPTHGVSLPHRPRMDHEEDDVRALTREQLATFLAVVDPRHRLMFQILAASGLRVSELIALRWRDLTLEGRNPQLRVRRAIVRDRVVPPKSKYGRRRVPLPAALVFELRRRRAATPWPGDDDLVFPSLNGTPLRPENIRRRFLAPAAQKAGAPGAGFHSFRHCYASMLFKRGANAVEVQHRLGHHSAAFTMHQYVHLLEGDAGGALDLEVELAGARKRTEREAIVRPIRPANVAAGLGR